MATYFHGHPDIQSASASAEGLQTLVLMNPTYVQYSDASTPIFINSAVPQIPPAASAQFLGIPLDVNSHELHGMLPRLQYNLYHPMDQASPARDTPRGLSLSLSSQQRPHQTYGSQTSAEDMRVFTGSASSGSVVTNGVTGLLSSKYLVAAHELLDEVVSVNGNALKTEMEGKRQPTAAVDAPEGCSKRAEELTTAERQDIQMKKAKLISMLDEVEQRYRQYDHQMQIVKSSFEQAAGIGSADTYTALALGTISKQFKCLKDAIVGQIKVANKALGEEDSFVGKQEESRLKYVDHHYRQQRALQQLGMIQHNAWRPQRGLPERSVSVLRAWLFEHFLHPYPKDSDKHMLAKQTGLTRSQVSNWFINARVRLWKPMVEEMYLEEIKEQEKTSSDGKPGRSDDVTLPKDKNTSASEKMPNPSVASINSLRNLSIVGNSDYEGVTQMSPKKPRSADLMQSNMNIKLGDAPTDQIPMKFDEERQSRDGFSFFGGSSNFIGGFGHYPIGEIERFEADQFAPRFSGNGVSLTLGLPNQELISLSGSHQSFIPNQTVQLRRRLDLGETNEFGSLNSPAAFDSSINSIPSRKRFAAQLLPTDFVS